MKSKTVKSTARTEIREGTKDDKSLRRIAINFPVVAEARAAVRHQLKWFNEMMAKKRSKNV